MGFDEQVDGITSEGALGDVDMFLGKIDKNGVWLNATTEGVHRAKILSKQSIVSKTVIYCWLEHFVKELQESLVT